MAEQNTQVCPVCGVKIVTLGRIDRVMFSSGPPGTRATLWARVCRYAQRPGCINQDQDAIGDVKPDDYYKENL